MKLTTDQGEDFDASDPEGDRHRDDCDREVVVHFADRVDESPAVRRLHDHAVRRVNEDHSAREHQRQDQDRPDRDRRRHADSHRDCDQGDFRRGVESEPEENPYGEDVPRFPDESEQRAEQAVQDAPLVQQYLQLGRVQLLVTFVQLDEHPVDADDDQDVHQADDDQEGGGDRKPDDLARALDRRVGDNHPRPDDERDGQDEDDRRVPKRKPGAHGERTLPILEQFPRRVVDGDDVVRIDPVPQAERVGDESESGEDRGDLADDESENETDGGGAEDQSIDNPNSDLLASRYPDRGGARVPRGGRGSSTTHVSEVTLVPH